jgi:aryl-alcohol dehydrogenase-like predicted oxidoreductase
LAAVRILEGKLMQTRKLGKSGIEVSAIGMGCWAIGGPFWKNGNPLGWGDVNDDESIAAVHKALDLGITFFDTADVYGCGHSERVLARALRDRREDVVIATKFGNIFDEKTRQVTGLDASPAFIRQACEASLRRLNTAYIDLYQFHWGDYPAEKAEPVRDTLDELVAAGKIRWYGWSTDTPDRTRAFAGGKHCTANQQTLSIFDGSLEVLEVCEANNLASINKGPLAKGLLTGKFSADSNFGVDDVRYEWDLRAGPEAERLKTVDMLRAILTRNGHTLAQAALAWNLAKSPNTIPIPGFRRPDQVEENAGVLDKGPLDDEQMREIEVLLRR